MSAESIVAAGAVGAITYVDGDTHTAGFANLATGELLTPRHRVRLGSIDKLFLAVSPSRSSTTSTYPRAHGFRSSTAGSRYGTCSRIGAASSTTCGTARRTSNWPSGRP